MLKKGRLTTVLLFVLVLSLLVPASAFALLAGNTSPGWIIYKAGSYRYGPSIIINEDHSVDMWTCSPGANGAWDFIRYRHSVDGGQTWTPDTVALQPTPGGRDALSACDPGVIKIGKYYYIAYTSTEDSRGTDNDVYVARGTSPTGPWFKWNGSGWGGNPQPFIVFDDPYTDTYGAGEPSLVAKDNKLYIYYTWMTKDSDGKPINQTRVSTASTTDDNWPGNMTYQGVAIQRDANNSEDSTDHKYVPSLRRFIAIGTAQRFSTDSYVKVYESKDGIKYTLASTLSANLKTTLHNIGISGNERGNYIADDNNFISYAYGKSWGVWNTYLNPFTLSDYTSQPDTPSGLTFEPGNGQVKLDWNASFGAASYNVKRSETAGGPYTTIASGVGNSVYTDTGLINGTTYYYVISAVNANGESENSAEISAVPKVYENIALHKTATSNDSLELVPDWGVSRLTDGITTSVSGSNGSTSNAYSSPDVSADPIWVQVDLGSDQTFDRVKLYPRSNATSTDGVAANFPVDFTIQTSSDGTNYTTVQTVTGQTNEDWAGKSFIFAATTARYVKINVTKLGSPASDEPANYRLQLAEIEVY